MGLIGIILLVGAIAIAGFIMLDTKLGSPPRPKALLISFIFVFIGLCLIVIDYNMPPTVQRAELTTNDLEIAVDKEIVVNKNQIQQLNKPVKVKIIRDKYPWYSIFNRNKIRLSFEKE